MVCVDQSEASIQGQSEASITCEGVAGVLAAILPAHVDLLLVLDLNNIDQ